MLPRKVLKKMIEKAKASEKNNTRIVFFDEGRFGTMSTVMRKWSLKGSKCEVVVKQGYKNFYVYSNACPKTGESFSLFLPEVNTEMMNIYLEELSKYYAGKKIILIMDQARWHKSKGLEVPKNIEIEDLPAYSPELNPVERLWKWLKEKTIHNRIFGKIEEVMDAVAEELNQLTKEKIMTLCRCS
jgi:transposase